MPHSDPEKRRAYEREYRRRKRAEKQRQERRREERRLRDRARRAAKAGVGSVEHFATFCGGIALEPPAGPER
jgi:hypothetical protein